jgi:predicted NBD/HSP70 family sugar kinase
MADTRNLGRLLRQVHLSGTVSRADLAERMGLNRSTIMALTAELSAAGLVHEEHPAVTGKAGRPSLVVRPNAEGFYVLAFDVAVDRLVAHFGRELHKNAPGESVCVGIGASYCGMIRPEDGTVRFAPDMGWVDQAFGAELGRRLGLGLPVAVGNEAHLGALAELERGAGAGFRNLVYLHGDVGVGGGIIVGGKLLDGDAGYGCELGHMLVNPYHGRPCGCGSAGCLEAEVGERALLEAAPQPAGLIGRDAVRAVVGAADRGDRPAREALRRVGDWLGIGVANLINLFNPGVVIFGGMLRDVYAEAAPQVAARIAQHAMPVSRERAQLRLSALADDATLIGAAGLGFAALLTDPLETARPMTRVTASSDPGRSQSGKSS